MHHVGTTSAHAENTRQRYQQIYPIGNYLRARGEYILAHNQTSITPELPPRTRRILRLRVHPMCGVGTTSAHAENTIASRLHRALERNYLRARGEYRDMFEDACMEWELPPRTRRIRSISPKRGRAWGTTSAHAENTVCRDCEANYCWNYLRARGEYVGAAKRPVRGRELPPRTRRIRCTVLLRMIRTGTTSAHAENTSGIP